MIFLIFFSKNSIAKSTAASTLCIQSEVFDHDSESNITPGPPNSLEGMQFTKADESF